MGVQLNGWPSGSQVPPSWQTQSGPGTGGMQPSGVPVPPVGGDGGVGGVSPDGRINGWPSGSQPPSWQIQSPGTGGKQLFRTRWRRRSWRLPACRQQVLRKT